ncbi:MAG: DUF3820 family protein [Proteobacteria bacterium]|nr:DUF3820 family protein [Pseudomonadota bacterium]
MVGEPELLLKLAKMRMPFGKYKGLLLIDLPEPYVIWFSQKGFPGGYLGEMLGLVYEIKVNGLEYLFDPLREGGQKQSTHQPPRLARPSDNRLRRL